MLKKKKLEQITNKYYAEILRYCQYKLQNDSFGADDCTQEVFLLLVRKADELNLKQNIRGWLYAVADRMILKYIKDKQKREELIAGDLESVSDVPAEQETHRREFDVLSDAEYAILKKYYFTDAAGREQLARELNISMNALYQRIYNITQKVTNNKNKNGSS